MLWDVPTTLNGPSQQLEVSYISAMTAAAAAKKMTAVNGNQFCASD